MRNRFTLLIFLSALVVFLISLVMVIWVSRNVNYRQIVESFILEDYEFSKKLVSQIPTNDLYYEFYQGLLYFVEGDYEKSTKNLSKYVKNTNINSEIRATSKMVYGMILLDLGESVGIEYISDPETYKYFGPYCDYLLGSYNFDKGDFVNSLEFLYNAAQIQSDTVKKDVYTKIYFSHISLGNIQEAKKVLKVLTNFEKDQTVVSNLIKNIENLESTKSSK